MKELPNFKEMCFKTSQFIVVGNYINPNEFWSMDILLVVLVVFLDPLIIFKRCYHLITFQGIEIVFDRLFIFLLHFWLIDK